VTAKPEPSLLKATIRVAAGTGRVTAWAIRIGMGVGGGGLTLAGALLADPLGLVIVGVPVAVLGVILLAKAVFW
jgi:hypothetical protein